MSKQYDLAVLGATGFTGNYVAIYLAERYANEISSGALKLAIAGRSKAKLEAVRKDMIESSKGLKDSDIAIVEYDAADQASVDNVVGSSRVVIACSGPFTRMGTPVVKACVEKKTDYVDITGGWFSF